MEVRRLAKVKRPEPGANNCVLDFGLGEGPGEGPEPAPAPSKIFVPEQHIYIDKPGF